MEKIAYTPAVIFLVVLFLVGFVFVSNVSAATYSCNSCTNCTNTINSANSGDTVELTQNISISVPKACIGWQNNNITFDCQGYGIKGYYYAFNDLYGNDNTIKNCKITSFAHGIRFRNSDNNKFENNEITNNDNGIYLYNSDNNKFENNEITNNAPGSGISTDNAHNNILSNNIISNYNYYGIYLYRSSNNTVKNNEITNNVFYGIDIFEGSDNNTLSNNTVSRTHQGSGIRLYASDYNTLKNNEITNNDYTGIILHSSNNTLENNEIKNNAKYGIYINTANNNILNNNTVSNNSYGIPIDGTSQYNILKNNKITNNAKYGIYTYYAYKNILSNNIVNNNSYGIYLNNSYYNKIYLNNFINNTLLNVYSSFSSDNTWSSPQLIAYMYNNSEYLSKLGNYWDDYTGNDSDGDGIGNTSYKIDEDDADNYPLMEPFENYIQIPSITESVMKETASSTHDLFETIISQNATLTASVTGNLNGSIDFTNIKFVTINSGSFEGKGFSKGDWKANLETVHYQGYWKGILFQKPDERKIYLKGMVSGGIKGVVEGYLIESVNGSGVYDQYQATWTISEIDGKLVFAEIDLNGRVNYYESTEYSSELYALQTYTEGEATGYYNGFLGVILTHVRIEDESNPYYGEGFSIISYTSELSSGEGWTYNRLESPNISEVNGLFTGPLEGIVSGTLDESGQSRTLSIAIERLDLGLPPAPDLKVKVWGPQRVSPGQTVDYIIEYRNDGVKAADDVVIVDKLPYQVKYISSTKEGEYNEAAHEVVWHLGNIAAKSNGVLTIKVTVLWGLPMNTFFENIVLIPKEEIEIETDPTVVANFVITEISEEYLKGELNISNQIYSDNISIESTLEVVLKDIDPIIKYNETTEQINVEIIFTMEGNSKDLIDAILKIPKRAKKLVDVFNDAVSFNKARIERQNFYDWLRDNNFVSETSYEELTSANTAYVMLKLIISGWGTVEPPPWKDILMYMSGDEFFGVVAGIRIADGIGYLLPLDYPDRAREAYYVYKEAYKAYLEATSEATSAYKNQVATARDPNIKYGPEGGVSAGQKLDYKVEYENEGEGIAFGVYFTDALDKDLDDSTLEIGPVIDVQTGTQIAPPGTYNPQTRTIIWFVGEVGPGEGGYAEFSINVKEDAIEGTEIINFGVVYFPSVPEMTRTNGIVSLVGLNQPPTADANGPYTGKEGSPITFDGSGSTDSDGDKLSYRWDFDGDGTWDTEWSTEPTAEHTWDDDHQGTIVLEVSDGEFTDTADTEVTIENIPPIVEAGPDQEVLVGETVYFEGSFTDPGADTHDIFWVFGDNFTATETLTPEHVYYDKGIYNVTLTVTDDDGGIGIDEVLIKVIPILANVRIEPETLNISAKGIFTAFITLPEPYDIKNINISTVVCEGAPAIKEKIIEERKYIAKFDRENLRKDLPTGEEVEMTVIGKVLHNGKYVDFEGSDIVRVVK